MSIVQELDIVTQSLAALFEQLQRALYVDGRFVDRPGMERFYLRLSAPRAIRRHSRDAHLDSHVAKTPSHETLRAVDYLRDFVPARVSVTIRRFPHLSAEQ